MIATTKGKQRTRSACLHSQVAVWLQDEGEEDEEGDVVPGVVVDGLCVGVPRCCCCVPSDVTDMYD